MNKNFSDVEIQWLLLCIDLKIASVNRAINSNLVGSNLHKANCEDLGVLEALKSKVRLS